MQYAIIFNTLPPKLGAYGVGGKLQELITGLKAVKIKILRLFGERVCQIYQLPSG
jgi:hypothetical protein